ncbi:MAG: TIGR01777 family protein [Crocinitomix sp.]|nr:TIGR01777 family protein [Crocinitomix sp.]
MMETVLITGGSGLIGQALSELLMQHGYTVRHLSRTVKGNEKYPTFKWDLSQNELDSKALENVNHIIHLAGENVGEGRWTAARKKRILSSRVDTVALIQSKLQPNQLKSFISASGISYYGTKTTENIFKESDPKGTDFLADISVQWEKKAFEMSSLASRVVALRTGVVLSSKGGALEKLQKPIKIGIGSALGSGKQYMPWIHIKDLCNLYLEAVQNTKLEGVYNAVSSQHTTNLEMTQGVAKVFGKKLWAPKVPAFILKLLFGEMAQIILEGSRIDNSKIKAAGIAFEFEDLDGALNDLISKN